MSVSKFIGTAAFGLIWWIVLNIITIPLTMFINLFVALTTTQVFLALFITWIVWLIRRAFRRPTQEK